MYITDNDIFNLCRLCNEITRNLGNFTSLARVLLLDKKQTNNVLEAGPT